MIRYWQTFSTFFKIGLFTIGGGYAMIPLIEHEVVDKKGWVKKDEFIDLLAVAQMMPGVFAVNISVSIGNKLHKNRGALIAAVGTVLPSFLCILLIVMFLHRYKEIPLIENIFMGIRPAVVALIAVPVFTMAKASRVTWGTCWVPLLAALLIWLCDVSPVHIVLIAILSAVTGYFVKKIVQNKRP